MSEIEHWCEMPHHGARGRIHAWLCAKSLDGETHVHVCGNHARRLRISGKFGMQAINRGDEYPHGVKSKGCAGTDRGAKEK